jgi:proteic killer suppression protein
MIISYADELTEKLMHGIVDRETRKLQPALRLQAARKLTMLDVATRLNDLYFPPGNRLHALGGDLEGYYAVSVNDTFRLVFRWTEQGPEHVQFTDYH